MVDPDEVIAAGDTPCSGTRSDDLPTAQHLSPLFSEDTRF